MLGFFPPKKNSCGEIATILTLLTVAMMVAGVVAGTKLNLTGARLLPQAADACATGLSNITAPGITGDTIPADKKFTCFVESTSTSNNLCGMSINGGWPVNCPYNASQTKLTNGNWKIGFNCDMSTSGAKTGDGVQLRAMRAVSVGANECVTFGWTNNGSYLVGPSYTYAAATGPTKPPATIAPTKPGSTTAPKPTLPPGITASPQPTQPPGGGTGMPNWDWYAADNYCSTVGGNRANCICKWINDTYGNYAGFCAPAPANPPRVTDALGRICAHNPWDESWGCWGIPAAPPTPLPPGATVLCYDHPTQYGTCNIGEGNCAQRTNIPGDPDLNKWFKCVDGRWMGPCETQTDCQAPRATPVPPTATPKPTTPPGNPLTPKPPGPGTPLPTGNNPNTDVPKPNGVIVINGTLSIKEGTISNPPIPKDPLNGRELILDYIQFSADDSKKLKIHSGILNAAVLMSPQTSQDSNGINTFLYQFGTNSDVSRNNGYIVAFLDEAVRPDISLKGKLKINLGAGNTPIDLPLQTLPKVCFPYGIAKDNQSPDPTSIPQPDDKNKVLTDIIQKCTGQTLIPGYSQKGNFVNTLKLSYENSNVTLTPLPNQTAYYLFTYKLHGLEQPVWDGYSVDSLYFDHYFTLVNKSTPQTLGNIYIPYAQSPGTLSSFTKYNDGTYSGIKSANTIIYQSGPDTTPTDQSVFQPDIHVKLSKADNSIDVNPGWVNNTFNSNFLFPCFKTTDQILTQCQIFYFEFTLPNALPTTIPTPNVTEVPTPKVSVKMTVNLEIREPGGTGVKEDDQLDKYIIPATHTFNMKLMQLQPLPVAIKKYVSYNSTDFTIPKYYTQASGTGNDKNGKIVPLYHAYQLLQTPMEYMIPSTEDLSKLVLTDNVFEVDLSMNPTQLWCGLSPGSISSPLKQNITLENILTAQVSSKHTINVTYYIDCQDGPFTGTSSPIIIQGSSNPTYAVVINQYAKGLLSATDVSVFLHQVCRAPGLQTQTFDPLKPFQGCEETPI